MKMILASSSPRRRVLLQRLNYPFDIILPNVDEDSLTPDGNPEEYCSILAEMKANDVGNQFPEALVIGADTIVVLDDHILGKPDDRSQAISMLESLSGKTHTVYTGVTLTCSSRQLHHQFSEMTMVKFREYSRSEITYYIDTCPPYDKAGSYGIQDWSCLFVKEITGCYDNVVGFPLSRFYAELKKLGINLLDSLSGTP
ncbi:MAG: Maf family protein [Candidatus Marinimicrobia bacterium]|jgi:septum formation protein|nr:Maf family protein [Candidatus Neomarinimicrobiota bacterium]MDP6852574.1 Maf family protein [Candidatus Neomarinimicrobiota bacterium]MDP6936021.1 Maf family protein [Candidatus Neomarinimicrobiota bacterium]